MSRRVWMHTLGGEDSPARIKGLSLWLHPTSGRLVTAGRVAEWYDASRYRHTFEQTNAARQPLDILIGEHPAARFEASRLSRLTRAGPGMPGMSGGGSRTLMLVYRPRAVNTSSTSNAGYSGAVFAAGNGGTRNEWIVRGNAHPTTGSDPMLESRALSGVDIRYSALRALDTCLVESSYDFNTDLVTLTKNDGEYASQQLLSSQKISITANYLVTLGAGNSTGVAYNCFEGDILEVALWPRRLLPKEVSRYRKYANRRYAIW